MGDCLAGRRLVDAENHRTARPGQELNVVKLFAPRGVLEHLHLRPRPQVDHHTTGRLGLAR